MTACLFSTVVFDFLFPKLVDSNLNLNITHRSDCLLDDQEREMYLNRSIKTLVRKHISSPSLLPTGGLHHSKRYQSTSTSTPPPLIDFSTQLIRSFCIIARQFSSHSSSPQSQPTHLSHFLHTDIDHGKSTLSDRLLEITHTIPTIKASSSSSLSHSHHQPVTANKQVLDKLLVERQRGITVKAVSVRSHVFS